MHRSILIPIDFSKNSLVAARYSLGFARHSGFDLHFLHAYLPFKSAFQTRADNEDERTEARDAAEEQMERFKKDLGITQQENARFELREGHLLKCLEQVISKEAVAFIIMGTHGETGRRKNILGSNTYDVATSLQIPLVIVPEDNAGFKLERVVFFTNYCETDKHTLEAFKDISGAPESSVTLVHIEEGSAKQEQPEVQKLEEWKERLQQETHYTGLKTELVPGDETIHIINHILKRLDADLTLLTLTRKRNFFDRLFYKSLAKAIVFNPETPVLLTSESE